MGENLIAQIEIEGELFELLPERCVYRPTTKTLIAADLHWGKAEVFQKHGLALPSSVMTDDLAKMDSALAKTKAETLLILGDLIHAPMGVTPTVIDQVAKWRATHPQLKFQLIRGNHDRKHVWHESWRIEDVGTSISDGHFLFTHDLPTEKVSEFIWAGHYHPVVNLNNGADSLRLPCFAVQIKKRRALLPAFSLFTGGAPLGTRTPDERVFVVADESVIEV